MSSLHTAFGTVLEEAIFAIYGSGFNNLLEANNYLDYAYY